MMRNVCVAPKIWQRGIYNRGSEGEIPSRRKPKGLGAWPPAANEFLRCSHKKTLHLAHFLIEKRHAVIQSLWTSAGPKLGNAPPRNHLSESPNFFFLDGEYKRASSEAAMPS